MAQINQQLQFGADKQAASRDFFRKLNAGVDTDNN
jgi:hypothetical protein